MRHIDRTAHASPALTSGALVLKVLETRRAYQVAMTLARKMLSADACKGMYWDDEPTDTPAVSTGVSPLTVPMTNSSAVPSPRGRAASARCVRQRAQWRVAAPVTPLRFRQRSDTITLHTGATSDEPADD